MLNIDFKRDIIKYFIIGSSIISTFITFTYIGTAINKNVNKTNMSEICSYTFYMYISIAIMYGLANILNVILLQNIMKINSLYASVITGACLGFIFSIIGIFYLNLPTTIFGYKDNQWQVHIIAIILYSFIFGFIINNLNNYF